MRLALATLAAALTFGVTVADAGTIPTGWSWVTPPMGHVGVVGDSLVYEAEHGPGPDPYYQRHYLIDALNGNGLAARVAAKSGATTASLKSWGQWQSPPETIVMALGTNDNYYSYPISTSIANVRTYLARWPNACVVYVGVVPSAPRGIADTAPAWNAWLAQEAARTGGVYLDWPALSAPHPEWFQSDLLHHTDTGRKAYRDAIVNGVLQCQ